MTSERKIHFQGEPFNARIPGPAGKPVLCVCNPVVYSREGSWGTETGVAIECLCEEEGLCEEGSQLQCWMAWGLIIPQNLFASWRAIEILRLHSEIGSTTLCDAWFAAERNGGDSDLGHTNSIIEKIGREAYEKAMLLPVPEQIISLALANPQHWDLFPITNEVRVGTILWRPEFADMGIKHPDQVDAEKAAEEWANRPWWKKILQMFQIST